MNTYNNKQDLTQTVLYVLCSLFRQINKCGSSEFIDYLINRDSQEIRSFMANKELIENKNECVYITKHGMLFLAGHNFINKLTE
jgi:hypothetical protein